MLLTLPCVYLCNGDGRCERHRRSSHITAPALLFQNILAAMPHPCYGANIVLLGANIMQPFATLCCRVPHHATGSHIMLLGANIMPPLTTSCHPVPCHITRCQYHVARCQHHVTSCQHHAAWCQHHVTRYQRNTTINVIPQSRADMMMSVTNTSWCQRNAIREKLFAKHW